MWGGPDFFPELSTLRGDLGVMVAQFGVPKFAMHTFGFYFRGGGHSEPTLRTPGAKGSLGGPEVLRTSD